MQEWRAAGLSQQAIADRLNEQEQTTRRGKAWSQVQVMRVLALAD
jgi:DNA-binding CsgD family transcriptional regulator